MHTCVDIKTHKSLKEPPVVWVKAKGGEDGRDTGNRPTEGSGDWTEQGEER